MRLGSQTPRIEHAPLFTTTAGDDAIDLAAAVGLELDEWQQHVLRVGLGERPDGRWSAFEVAFTIPRQNGKGAILEARELAGLFLFGEDLIMHSAHEFKTATEAFNRILGLVQRSSELSELIDGWQGSWEKPPRGVATAHGFEGITLKTGQRLKFVARSGRSGRGFTGDVNILDEAFNLNHAALAALMPTMAAKSITGNPQIWYTSSAGMPSSEVLEELRERGMSGKDERLAYIEHSAPDDADPDDREAWYQANPGLGIRISEEHVANERASMDDESFKRERLGIWARVGGESVFRPGAWAALADAGSKRGDRFVFAVEIAGNRESATICMVSERADGLTHVEVVDEREGTSWLGSRLRELQDRHQPDGVWAIAGGHADALSGEWRREGVKVRWLKWADYVKACGTFYSMVSEGRVRHLDDPILNEAVEGVKQTFTRDNAAFHWSRKGSTAEISSLVGVTVGVAALAKRAWRSDVRRKGAVIL